MRGAIIIVDNIDSVKYGNSLRNPRCSIALSGRLVSAAPAALRLSGCLTLRQLRLPQFECRHYSAFSYVSSRQAPLHAIIRIIELGTIQRCSAGGIAISLHSPASRASGRGGGTAPKGQD